MIVNHSLKQYIVKHLLILYHNLKLMNEREDKLS
jgi:hypothetical protein